MAARYKVRPISDRTWLRPAGSRDYSPFSATWSDTIDLHNVRAIALTLQALRAVDRYGATRRAEQYQGFRALPPGTGVEPTGMTVDVALEVITRESGDAPDYVRGAAHDSVRRARARAHPDRNNGDRSRWDAVDQAEQVLRRAGRL